MIAQRRTTVLIVHSITSSTAHILNMQGQMNIPRSFYQQKNDAIVAINKDLAVPDLVPSDALIMAVSAMVIIEVRQLKSVR